MRTVRESSASAAGRAGGPVTVALDRSAFGGRAGQCCLESGAQFTFTHQTQRRCMQQALDDRRERQAVPESGGGSLDTASEGSGGFVAAESFAGAKPGYSFKNGPLGVGYYREEAAQPTSTQPAASGPPLPLVGSATATEDDGYLAEIARCHPRECGGLSIPGPSGF